MPTYPLPTLAATISTGGISAPTYADILASLQASFQSIYGSDVYLGPDSQDGQFLAIFAKAIYDANMSLVATYNSFSPATAQGVGLSSMVKINGLVRNTATSSQVPLTLTGVAGTVINNGQVADTNSNVWNLPASVTIGVSGSVATTGTAVTVGAVSASVGSVTTIRTPTLGWQSVTNPTAATPGEPVETDVALRARQALSVALPSRTVLDGCIAALETLPGVLGLSVIDNSTNATDSNGVPAHSVAFVVDGGDTNSIATTIFNKKGPGAGTYGTTTVTVTDSFGVATAIKFYRPTVKTITVNLTLKALAGFVTPTGDLVKQAISDYINALSIGEDVLLTKLYLPANLFGGTYSNTFEVTALTIAISPGSPAGSDLVIAFDEVANCQLANINLTVV